MKTFLQALRLAFWTHPLQRALTCIGVVVIVADSIRMLSFSGFRFASNMGFSATSLVSLLMGGVYWRMASASRMVHLAPHGRTRLLGSFLGVLLLVTLAWSVPDWLFFLHRMDPELMSFKPFMTWQLLNVADAVLAASVAVAGLFMASRSPFAALVVLVVVASPAIADTLFDLDFQRHLRPLPRAAVPLALIWIPFSIWYLKARRISPPRWLVSGGQDVLATSLVRPARPRSRREALERQLLGGTTVMQLSLTWFVVLGLLLALQWVIVSLGEPGDSALVARVMYASLCICPVVTTVVSFAAIRRSRALWLLAGSTRSAFFACVERILIRLNLAMALVFAIWLAALWFTQSWRPASVEDQVALGFFHVMGLWLLGSFAIYTQLAGWPKWPVAMIAAGMLIFVWCLTTLPVTTFRGEAVVGLTATILLIAAPVTGIVLRWQAQRRWCEGDLPRLATSTASGT